MTIQPYFPENLQDYAPWVTTHGLTAPYGECQCGCGQKTNIAQRTQRSAGRVRGEPSRYLVYHQYKGRSLHGLFWQHVTEGNPDECWEWQSHTAMDTGLLRGRREA